MKYMIAIYEAPEDFAARTDPERSDAYWSTWTAYFESLGAAGIAYSGTALQGPETGTSLRGEGSDRIVQDGPFADTKEQLGGYFLMEAPDLDAALKWSAKCPSVVRGGVEVRPVFQTQREV